MNFRFNISKGTEAACLFLERSSGRINIMKLVKLIYLLDRLSLARRGIPVVGGDYLSMRNGPVTSEVLDLINAGRLADETDEWWEKCVSDRRNHEVALVRMPDCEHLAETEIALIDEVWGEHGGRDQWQLRDWCHAHCAEWEAIPRGCAPIHVERIGIALSKPPGEVERMAREAAELNLLDEIFAAR